MLLVDAEKFDRVVDVLIDCTQSATANGHPVIWHIDIHRVRNAVQIALMAAFPGAPGCIVREETGYGDIRK